jgi:hypothetical protein
MRFNLAPALGLFHDTAKAALRAGVETIPEPKNILAECTATVPEGLYFVKSNAF